jgi:hypothetical protein
MSVIIQGAQLRAIAFGVQVTSSYTALPATTLHTLFTVAGGRVVVTSLTGIVTTVVQAQACAIKLVATPGAGTANDMSGTLDINAAEAGALLSLHGTLATALQGGVSKSGAVPAMNFAQIVNTGTIGVNTAATNTGAITWTATYIPYDTGATLVSV